MSISSLISGPKSRGAGRDPPPVQGLGPGYPTVCLVADADRLGSLSGRLRNIEESCISALPAGNGAVSLLRLAASCRRKGYRQAHRCGPCATLAKSPRARQAHPRGCLWRLHTHTVNMRSTSSDDSQTGMSSSFDVVSEAVPRSSLYFRCCETQLRPMSST